MNKARENMIASLTDTLEPVRSFRMRDGLLLVGIAALLTLIAVAAIEGLWHGIAAGEASPFFWVTNGLLLVLGLSAASAVVAMASPAVGNRHDAPRWASAMLGVLPIAALTSLGIGDAAHAVSRDPYWLHCLTSSLAASVVTGGALVLWLRRGAPVSAESAGWLTGLAAGALGTLIYGLSCTYDAVAHLGIWHVVPVALASLAGRLIVPRVIRW